MKLQLVLPYTYSIWSVQFPPQVVAPAFAPVDSNVVAPEAEVWSPPAATGAVTDLVHKFFPGCFMYKNIRDDIHRHIHRGEGGDFCDGHEY